jgi:hypothetical protein
MVPLRSSPRLTNQLQLQLILPIMLLYQQQ